MDNKPLLKATQASANRNDYDSYAAAVAATMAPPPPLSRSTSSASRSSIIFPSNVKTQSHVIATYEALPTESTDPDEELIQFKRDLPTEEPLIKNDLSRLEGSRLTNVKGSDQFHVDLDMNAKVSVESASAEATAGVSSTAAYLFKQFVTDLERIEYRPRETQQATAMRAWSKLHDKLENVIGSPKGELLRRQSSIAVKNFSSAKDLLSVGIEGYVKTVRKLLKSELDSNIDIVFKDLDYTAPNPMYKPIESDAHGQASGRDTVGDRIKSMFCCFCIAARNALASTRQDDAHANVLPITNQDRSTHQHNDHHSHRHHHHHHPKPKRLHILKKLTGIIKAGRFTLVLGPPGAGKTTMLQALAGKLSRPYNGTELTGELKYNGYDVADIKHLANWVSYVGQSEQHHALLTTKETLNFAFQCRKEIRYNDPNIRNKLGPERAAKLEALRHVDVDATMAVLGLDVCANTIIGNDILKGVSGGEKRRVTLGEMVVTGSQILCCDEISTGLDSSTTYDICQYLQKVTHAFAQPIVVALLQPPPEVIDLFDDIMVIADGNIIYHGPVTSVLQYFNDLGFFCPPRKDLGDFLQEIPTSNGAAYFNANWTGKPQPRTPAEFAQRWKESEMFQEQLREVDKSVAKSLDEAGYNYDLLPQNSTLKSFSLVFNWLWTLRMRAKAQIAVKLIQNIVMGLLFGSIFWQIEFDEWYMKSVLLMQLVMFSLSNTIPEGIVMFAQREIIYKHVDASFYSGLMFILANFIVSVPFVLFDILVFGNIVYWMCGMSNVRETYLTFILIAVLFGLCMNTIMGLYPFITRTQESQTVSAVLTFMLSILTSGTIASPNVMPSWIKWLYWINPFAWAYRAAAINEYHSGKYDQNPCKVNIQGHELNVGMRCGDFFLESRQIETSDDYIWKSHVILISYLVLFLGFTAYALTYVRFDVDRAEKDEDGDPTKKSVQTLESLKSTSSSGVSLSQTSSSESQNSSSMTIPIMQKQQSVIIPTKILAVKELWYTLEIKGQPVDLLKGVSLYALPGRMTALMGASGAGKTTLLDVLAGRKTQGTIKGDICVNGEPKIQHEYIRYVGYVEQFGVHSPSATVKESLEFSAALRLDPNEVTDERRAKFVEETLKLLELDDIQYFTTSALSVEQNKRLTIGVELVANPSILFCDEPTSGLDARAAAIVMRAVQRVARTGRTVICTIHQPSIAIFNLFDDLLLLKRGGQVVYFGELGQNSSKMISYFEAIPGVSQCPDGYNPATWMLEMIGAGTAAAVTEEMEHSRRIDFASAYERSEIYRNNMKALEEEYLIQYGSATSPRYESYQKRLTANPGFTTSFANQFNWLLHRNLTIYWRTPDYSLNRNLVIICISLLFAFLNWQQDVKDAADLQSRIMCIGFCVSIIGTYNMFSQVPFIIQHRALFYRERASRLYGVFAHVLAEGVVEIPYVIVETLIGVAITYWMVGLRSEFELYAYFNLASILYVLLLTYVGGMFAALVKDPMAGQLAAGLLNQMLLLFSGTFIPGNEIPSYYKWLYYISPMKYLQEGLLVTQFHGDHTLICNPTGKIVDDNPKSPLYHKFCTEDGKTSFKHITGQVVTAESYALDDFLSSYHYDNRWIDIIVLASLIIFIRTFTFLVTAFISHEKR